MIPNDLLNKHVRFRSQRGTETEHDLEGTVTKVHGASITIANVREFGDTQVVFNEVLFVLEPGWEKDIVVMPK